MVARQNPSPGLASNPGKKITIEPFAGTVTVTANGATIASSTRAKLLTESPYPPIVYVPFGDISFAELERTDLSTHCPFKGDASYWNVKPAGAQGKNAMWAYETPFDEMEAIKDHGAFYPDRVTIDLVAS